MTAMEAREPGLHPLDATRAQHSSDGGNGRAVAAMVPHIVPEWQDAATAPDPTVLAEPLVPLAQVARDLGVHINTAKRMIATTGLPAYRVTQRGDWRCSPAEVRAWLEARRP